MVELNNSKPLTIRDDDALTNADVVRLDLAAKAPQKIFKNVLENFSNSLRLKILNE